MQNGKVMPLAGICAWTRVAVLAVISCFAAGTASAQSEEYKPTIWVDPDGCEHWVMDDGLEGYMANHLDKQGKPVCRDIDVCGTLPDDTLFLTDSARIPTDRRTSLMDFFDETDAAGYVIIGHTDSRASRQYNQALSERRARAVADVARSAGAQVVDVRGRGELEPVAPNNSAANMRKNRRVEIQCQRKEG